MGANEEEVREQATYPSPEEIDYRRLRVFRAAEDSRVLVAEIGSADDNLNLFGYSTLEDLAALWGALRTSSGIGAVVLTARGQYFSAGGSFDLMSSQSDPAKVEYLARLTRRLYSDMLEQPVPVVCALNGPAFGAACSVALLSDLRVATPAVTFSDPHVKRGLTAGLGVGIWSLYLGPARSKRFLLLGETMSASQANHYGMVDAVVSEEKRMTVAMEWAGMLAAQPPLAVSHTKLLANRLIAQTLDATQAIGMAWQAQDFRTADHAEAIAAFREGRSPTFQGR